MKTEWSADWAWGLPLTAITLAIHGAAVSGIAVVLTRAETSIESRRPRRTLMALIVAATVGGVGGILAVLTGLEATIWAGAYLLLGAVGTLGDAMLYSVDSITARGSSGLELQRHWKMMGALEAVNGLLLFGISTAFLVSVITEVWSLFRRMTHRPVMPDSGMER
jgi:hypothetical protein